MKLAIEWKMIFVCRTGTHSWNFTEINILAYYYPLVYSGLPMKKNFWEISTK